MKNTLKNKAQQVRIALTLSLGTVLALGAFTLGCSDETDEVAAVSTQSEALSDTEDDGRMHREHRMSGKHDRQDGMRKMRGHRGKRTKDPGQMLFKTALRQESLTAEQRQTVEKLATAKRAERNSRHDASRSEFHATIAQAVRSGKLDTEAVKAHFEKRAAEREARRAAHTEALNTLYATLTPEQRAAVVTDIKARFDTKNDSFEGRKHREGDGRGFEKGNREKRHDKGGFGMFQGLNLTAEQQQQLAALEPNPTGRFTDKTARNTDRAAARQEMKQCRTDYLESFAGEKFDAAARCSKRSAEDRSAKMTQHFENFQKMLTILTDEQRNQPADRMEQAPAPHRNHPRI